MRSSSSLVPLITNNLNNINLSFYKDYGILRTAFSESQEDPVILLCFQKNIFIMLSSVSEKELT